MMQFAGAAFLVTGAVLMAVSAGLRFAAEGILIERDEGNTRVAVHLGRSASFRMFLALVACLAAGWLVAQ